MDLFFCLLLLWCLCSTSQASRSYELSLIGKKASQSKSVVYNTKEANLAIDGDISTKNHITEKSRVDIMDLVFCLLFLWCLCSTSQESHLYELSLIGKYADQIMTSHSHVAQFAIDGDIDTCSIAEPDGSSVSGWWKVDLGGLYDIGQITITASKTDKYAEYLQSFSIWRLNADGNKMHCAHSSDRFKTLETRSFTCSGKFPTRYVKIIRDQNSNFKVGSIAIAEVRVIIKNPAGGYIMNQKDVSHSKTCDGHDASLAFDKKTDTFSLSAWREQPSDRGWWQIEFTQDHHIGAVSITASNYPNYANYLQMFSIWLIDEDEAKHICYKYTSETPIAAGETQTFQCENYLLLTRRVRIARDGGHRQDAIALAEVKFTAGIPDSMIEKD